MFQGCSSTKNLPGLVTQRFVPAGLVGLLNVVTGIFVDSAVCTRTEDEVRKKQLFLGNGGGWIRIVLGSIRFTDLLLLLFTLKPPLWPCASTENHRAHLCFSSKKKTLTTCYQLIMLYPQIQHGTRKKRLGHMGLK